MPSQPQTWLRCWSYELWHQTNWKSEETMKMGKLCTYVNCYCVLFLFFFFFLGTSQLPSVHKTYFVQHIEQEEIKHFLQRRSPPPLPHLPHGIKMVLTILQWSPLRSSTSSQIISYIIYSIRPNRKILVPLLWRLLLQLQFCFLHWCGFSRQWRKEIVKQSSQKLYLQYVIIYIVRNKSEGHGGLHLCQIIYSINL